ncbi:MAG: hypothetical protein ACTHU0_34000 [Kofleriaceae bacterium]
MKLAAFVLASLTGLVTGCATTDSSLQLTEVWPSTVPSDYPEITERWTRAAILRGEYQEALEVAATFKSPEWRAADAEKDANARGLVGPARAQRLAEAQAEAAGPYEFELMVTTWDRRENDLDRGDKSSWRVRMLDDEGREIEPLEIVKDRRPSFVVRAQFPAFGDFATAYVARFPRSRPLLGPNVKAMRMRISGQRGAVQLNWIAR